MSAAIIAAASCTPVTAAIAASTPTPRPPIIVPAGTKITVGVSAPIVSNVAKTGEAFAFIIQADVVVGGTVVVRKGAVGSGTIALAGGAGGHGHEGNLHLLFDRVGTTLNVPLPIGVESDFSGHKQRTLAIIGGVSVLTGFGAAIRGGQAVVVPDQPIDLVLKTDVCIEAAGSTLCAQRIPRPDASAAP